MAKTSLSREAMAPLDTLLTRRFLPTVAILIAVPIAAFTLVVALTSMSLIDANRYVDSAAKIVATLAAAAWALNRYFTNRVDAPQLRVDPKIDFVPPGAFEPNSSDGLLLCRLDIVNTGKVRFKDYLVEVEIASVELRSDGAVIYSLINEPQTLEGDNIEPGSWAAHSYAMALEQEIKAVRVYVEITLKVRPSQKYWTWHQAFKLPTDSAETSGQSVTQ